MAFGSFSSPSNGVASPTSAFTRHFDSDCSINATPSIRPEAVVWAPLVGRPADCLPSGTVGQWLPAPCNGGPCQRAATLEPIMTRRGRLGPRAGIPKRQLPNCHSCQRGTLKPAWVAHKRGGGPKTPVCEGEGTGGPWRRGATLPSAGCRGNCWYSMGVWVVKSGFDIVGPSPNDDKQARPEELETLSKSYTMVVSSEDITRNSLSQFQRCCTQELLALDAGPTNTSSRDMCPTLLGHDHGQLQAAHATTS